MDELTKIPTSKVQRASKFIKTGAKVGGNYLKYFAKKTLMGNEDKDTLNQENADDIFESLSELKGSALKAAQMLSMDQGILPKAYADKFQMAQYSVPPLSRPLVEKTFKKSLGKGTLEIFDTFSESAINAASIGQVHKATKGKKTYAVKIQYPGVADSVHSDLRMAKPLAARIMNVKAAELDHYMGEVEAKMLEETDYELELKKSISLSEKCSHLEGVIFPKYYKKYSSNRILTMDWIDGVHIQEWLTTNPSQKKKNKIAQAIWDFYAFQIHELREFHADPHPGNFIITKDDKVAIIDFGCTKAIPKSFYDPYFQLLNFDTLSDDTKLTKLFYKLEMLYKTDTEQELALFFNIFKEMVSLLARPFEKETYDFSDPAYFEKIFKTAESYQLENDLRKYNTARGSKHTIYINRTYFGVYHIMHQFGATVKTLN